MGALRLFRVLVLAGDTLVLLLIDSSEQGARIDWVEFEGVCGVSVRSYLSHVDGHFLQILVQQHTYGYLTSFGLDRF